MRKVLMERFLAVVLLLGVLAVPPDAEAQVYRWTDDRGGVNYGSKPPPGARNVSRLDEDRGNVSTVPGIPREEVDAMRDRAQQQRADRLERELEAERRANRAAPGPGFDERAWIERCRAERRVDCDDPSRGSLYDPGFAFYPPVVRPPRPIPPRPLPPQQQLPWPSPGGAVVPSPRPDPGPRIRGPATAVPLQQ